MTSETNKNTGDQKDDSNKNTPLEEIAPKTVIVSSKENSEKPEEEKDKPLKTESTGSEPRVESLKQAIVKQAIEEDEPLSARFTLRKILGGDILSAQAIRSQIWLIVLVVFFVIIYISNRYSVQKDMIEIDRLQVELQNAKYRALSTSSQLTERNRESHILQMLKNNKDSVLKIANQPPYIINVPEE